MGVVGLLSGHVRARCRSTAPQCATLSRVPTRNLSCRPARALTTLFLPFAGCSSVVIASNWLDRAAARHAARAVVRLG